MPDDHGRPKDPAYMRLPLTYFMVRQIYRFGVRCRACGRKAQVYLTTLMNKHGSEAVLSTVRLKCTRCKSRDIAIVPDMDYRPEGNVIRFPERPG